MTSIRRLCEPHRVWTLFWQRRSWHCGTGGFQTQGRPPVGWENNDTRQSLKNWDFSPRLSPAVIGDMTLFRDSEPINMHRLSFLLEQWETNPESQDLQVESLTQAFMSFSKSLFFEDVDQIKVLENRKKYWRTHQVISPAAIQVALPDRKEEGKKKNEK